MRPNGSWKWGWEGYIFFPEIQERDKKIGSHFPHALFASKEFSHHYSDRRREKGNESCWSCTLKSWSLVLSQRRKAGHPTMNAEHCKGCYDQLFPFFPFLLFFLWALMERDEAEGHGELGRTVHDCRMCCYSFGSEGARPKRWFCGCIPFLSFHTSIYYDLYHTNVDLQSSIDQTACLLHSCNIFSMYVDNLV